MSFVLRRLQVRYGAVTAVDEVSLDVKRGEVVALIGANGAGKSSILTDIVALVPHAAERLEIDGHALLKAETRARLLCGISGSVHLAWQPSQ